MAKGSKRGISWQGNRTVKITKGESEAKSSLFGVKAEASQSSQKIRMSESRFESERTKVKSDNEFSTSLLPFFYYENIGGEKFHFPTHLLEYYNKEDLEEIADSADTDDIPFSDSVIWFHVLTGGGRTNFFPYYLIQNNETLWGTGYAGKTAMGIGDDSENLDRERKGEGGNVYIFTDSRVFVIFCPGGSSDAEDAKRGEYLNLLNKHVDNVDVSGGFTKNRVSLEMDGEYDRETYHIWLNTDTHAKAIEEIANRIIENGDSDSFDGDIRGSIEPFNGEETTNSEPEGRSSSRSESSLKSQEEQKDALDKIEQLSEMKDRGVITEEEFEEKKSELLDKV